MSQYKKVLITIPESLLDEIDAVADSEKTSRSELIRQVMKEYVDKHNKKCLRDALISGYREMGKLNLDLAQMCFDADNECQRCYEEKLAESE